MSMRFKGGVISATAPTTSTSAAKGVWTTTQQLQAVSAGTWPRSPGAPTIGTATAGASEATVAYTAPTDVGVGTVTYTATSSPGGFTGTGTSPITVTGLTIGSSYTFTVTGTTPGGTGPASAASNSIVVLAVPPIGAAYGGGYFAGQISTAGTGVANFNLVVGPIASAQSNAQWKTSNSSGDPTSVIDGPGNSTTMNSTTYPAAYFCKGLTIGGYSDWYMPALNELDVVYFGLKPTTSSNDTAVGINANSVPKRTSNYTAGTPAQTSAAVFQSSGAQAFTAGYYWSSTQKTTFPGSIAGYVTYFDSGSLAGGYKTQVFPVRAVRRVAV
jgi:hypothetical protein